MKLYVTALMLFLFISCSGKPQANNAVVDENWKAKNKQTATLNEVTEITQTAQKIEQRGRGMEMFRQAGNPENMRECNVSMEEGQKQIKDLDARIKNLPESYNAQLTPIITDLSECVSCSKNAKTSCVNARASINKAIKEIYPQ